MEDSKGKIKSQLPLEHIFEFCITLEKITENLGFHLTLKLENPQDIIFTAIATDINVTINSFYLYDPLFIQIAELKYRLMNL